LELNRIRYNQRIKETLDSFLSEFPGAISGDFFYFVEKKVFA
jgi:hypothetical protein